MNLLRQLFNGKNAVNQFLKNGSYVYNTGVRTLFAPSGMGFDGYVHAREKTKLNFADNEERFKIKMAEFSDENSKHMIFTEDLKTMVHLAQSDEDLQIILSMMRKFNSQNKELRFGSFIFGPVIMRMYHFLNRPVEALQVFRDEKLNGFFDQLISFQILMDLLFTNNMFKEVQEVFDIIKEKQLQPRRYPKNVVVLYFAACYKLNNKEAFDRVVTLWKDLATSGDVQMRRAITFASAIALKQGSPHIALEMLSQQHNQNYITVRNLKTWALAEIGRLDDIFPILRSVLNNDNPLNTAKHTFMKEVMDRTRQAFEQCSDKELISEFQRIDKQLQGLQLISDESLDSVLCSEIKAIPKNDPNQTKSFVQGSYRAADFRRNNTTSRIGRPGGSQYRERPGLADMN